MPDTVSATETASGQIETVREAGVADYLALLKPRVMSLVVFTGFVGLVLAPGTINPVIGAVAILCIALGAGASGALNMWYDADIDAVMSRTCDRPIPAGMVTPGNALGLGAVVAAASVTLMGLAVNLMAAGLLAFTIGFYIFIYTMWLKRRTAQNIVIGGASGALPPVIGWAAVTGNVTVEPLILFAIIFMWTPPHFWALALYRKDDYQDAGIPMLPVVAGLPETRRQILLYSLALVPLTLLPGYMGFAGMIYSVPAALLGAVFLYCALRVWRESDEAAPRELFGYSIFYLFMLFALLLADGFLPGGGA